MNKRFFFMLRIVCIVAIHILSFSVQSSLLRLYAQNSANSTSLSSLRQYIGQMPTAFLKQEPQIQERLEKLLGAKEYERLQNRLQYELPIELYGDVLILRAEQPYTPGNPKAIVGIGLASNKIHCALIENNGRAIYSEEPKKIPSDFNRFIIVQDKRTQEELEKKKKAESAGSEKK